MEPDTIFAPRGYCRVIALKIKVIFRYPTKYYRELFTFNAKVDSVLHISCAILFSGLFLA